MALEKVLCDAVLYQDQLKFQQRLGGFYFEPCLASFANSFEHYEYVEPLIWDLRLSW